MRDRLDALLARLGLPPVGRIEPHTASRRFENYRLELSDGSVHLLRVARIPEAHRGLLHEAAAHRALGATELPVVSDYLLVDPAVFEAPASLQPWLEGLAGDGVMSARPEALPGLCQRVGELRAALEERTLGGFGLSVVDGAFTPIRPVWSEEYLARVWDWFGRAESVGASLGPLSLAMMDTIEELAPTLDTATRFCLVHGDLRPSNVLWEVGRPPEKDAPPPVEVRGVVDWELAVRADPLMGFAGPLEMPPEALACVIGGYGRDAVAGWLEDPDALARLRVYSLGRVFQYLALVVSAQIEGGGPSWGLGMAYAARLGSERLRESFVADRLRAALPETLPESLELPDPSDRVRAVIHRALGRLRCRPVLGPSAAPRWLGAVAGALRDAGHEDEGWVRDASDLLDGLGPEIAARRFEPIPDRGAWLEEMDARFRAADDFTTGVWGFLLAAIRHASGSTEPEYWVVPDDVLRGAQSFLETLARGVAPADARGRARDAVLAIAAEQHAADLGLASEVERVRDRHTRLLEAWEDLTVFGGSTPRESGPEDYRARDPGAAGWAVPVLLYATASAPGLPIPLRQLVGTLSTQPGGPDRDP